MSSLTPAVTDPDAPPLPDVACAALYLRCKVHILEGHLAVARRDISRAAALDPSQKAVAALGRDVERRISRRQKSDRKLAKEIGKWVSTAMEGGGGGGEGSGAAAEAECDF